MGAIEDASIPHGLLNSQSLRLETSSLLKRLKVVEQRLASLEAKSSVETTELRNYEIRFDSVEDALQEMRLGNFIVVLDNEDRENEGDLVMAAEFVTKEKMAFLVKHSSGLVVVPMEGSRLDQLELPLMVPNNTEKHQTAFTHSVDYKHGFSLFISFHTASNAFKV
eukprot:Sdes_comp18748_c0_seq2m9119